MLGRPPQQEGQEADVCLILEGTYPYIPGGVSTWVHDLIATQTDLSFHLISIMPDNSRREQRYELPPNVLSLEHVYIHNLPKGQRRLLGIDRIVRQLEEDFILLQSGEADLASLHRIQSILNPLRDKIGSRLLLNSEATWRSICRSYQTLFDGYSFIDYFWTWRGLIGGLLAALLTPLPTARVYHSISTGYAGLLAARARVETGRPALLTEHGIYTNERRIEITSASWLSEGVDSGLLVDKPREDIRDMWLTVFVNYARICYEGCDLITTLYSGNQDLQRLDGAEDHKLKVIPNGIDFERFSAIRRDQSERRPACALIGRVVPIKDVKTFIRACGILAQALPDFDAFIMGPTDEDPDYFEECEQMVAHAGLGSIVTFTGRVRIDEYLGRLDAIVLTSISEAQPLVILEAGAAGVPTVATNVGACREMLEGMPDETPKLGEGGIVTGLSNPAETAQAIGALLTDPARREACSKAIQERVRRYYNKVEIDRRYFAIYDHYRRQPTARDISVPPPEAVA
ncbi:MAG: GT4 family glycosyltransferase PelF [Magnetovibrionaceae bacterium]